MSISPRNLWPEDIAVTDVVAPVTILREQASLLGERTKNLVEGRVTQTRVTTIDEAFNLAGEENGGASKNFKYNFDLLAPALRNYQYRLFSISHGVEFYPLTIDSTVFDSDVLDMPAFRINSEEELLRALAKIFSAEKTKSVIGSLIAQSKA